jgi:hypothetical protein
MDTQKIKDGDETVAKFSLPETSRIDNKVGLRHFKVRTRIARGGKTGGIHIVELGKWKPKAGVKDPKKKEDFEFDAAHETILVSLTTDNTTELALDQSLGVMWFKEHGFTEEVNFWRLEDLLKKEKELETLKEAFAILSDKGVSE